MLNLSEFCSGLHFYILARHECINKKSTELAVSYKYWLYSRFRIDETPDKFCPPELSELINFLKQKNLWDTFESRIIVLPNSLTDLNKFLEQLNPEELNWIQNWFSQNKKHLFNFLFFHSVRHLELRRISKKFSPDIEKKVLSLVKLTQDTKDRKFKFEDFASFYVQHLIHEDYLKLLSNLYLKQALYNVTLSISPIQNHLSAIIKDDDFQNLFFSSLYQKNNDADSTIRILHELTTNLIKENTTNLLGKILCYIVHFFRSISDSPSQKLIELVKLLGGYFSNIQSYLILHDNIKQEFLHELQLYVDHNSKIAHFKRIKFSNYLSRNSNNIFEIPDFFTGFTSGFSSPLSDPLTDEEIGTILQLRMKLGRPLLKNDDRPKELNERIKVYSLLEPYFHKYLSNLYSDTKSLDSVYHEIKNYAKTEANMLIGSSIENFRNLIEKTPKNISTPLLNTLEEILFIDIIRSHKEENNLIIRHLKFLKKFIQSRAEYIPFIIAQYRANLDPMFIKNFLTFGTRWDKYYKQSSANNKVSLFQNPIMWSMPEKKDFSSKNSYIQKIKKNCPFDASLTMARFSHDVEALEKLKLLQHFVKMVNQHKATEKAVAIKIFKQSKDNLSKLENELNGLKDYELKLFSILDKLVFHVEHNSIYDAQIDAQGALTSVQERKREQKRNSQTQSVTDHCSDTAGNNDTVFFASKLTPNSHVARPSGKIYRINLKKLYKNRPGEALFWWCSEAFFPYETSHTMPPVYIGKTLLLIKYRKILDQYQRIFIYRHPNGQTSKIYSLRGGGVSSGKNIFRFIFLSIIQHLRNIDDESRNEFYSQLDNKIFVNDLLYALTRVRGLEFHRSAKSYLPENVEKIPALSFSPILDDEALNKFLTEKRTLEEKLRILDAPMELNCHFSIGARKYNITNLLAQAVYENNYDKVLLLLKNGADLNKTSYRDIKTNRENFLTPIFVAVVKNNIHLARLLIYFPIADINKITYPVNVFLYVYQDDSNNKRHNCLKIALININFEMVVLLVENGAPFNEIMFAKNINKIQKILRIIKNKKDIENANLIFTYLTFSAYRHGVDVSNYDLEKNLNLIVANLNQEFSAPRFLTALICFTDVSKLTKPHCEIIKKYISESLINNSIELNDFQSYFAISYLSMVPDNEMLLDLINTKIINKTFSFINAIEKNYAEINPFSTQKLIIQIIPFINYIFRDTSEILSIKSQIITALKSYYFINNLNARQKIDFIKIHKIHINLVLELLDSNDIVEQFFYILECFKDDNIGAIFTRLLNTINVDNLNNEQKKYITEYIFSNKIIANNIINLLNMSDLGNNDNSIKDKVFLIIDKYFQAYITSSQLQTTLHDLLYTDSDLGLLLGDDVNSSSSYDKSFEYESYLLASVFLNEKNRIFSETESVYSDLSNILCGFFKGRHNVISALIFLTSSIKIPEFNPLKAKYYKDNILNYLKSLKAPLPINPFQSHFILNRLFQLNDPSLLESVSPELFGRAFEYIDERSSQLFRASFDQKKEFFLQIIPFINFIFNQVSEKWIELKEHILKKDYLSDIFLCLNHEEKSAFIIKHQLNLEFAHKAIPNIRDIYNPDLVMYAIESNNMKYATAIADALSSTDNFSIKQRMECLDLILANKIEEPDSASIVHALINVHKSNPNESKQKNQLILYWITQNLNKKYQSNPSFLAFLEELLNQDNSWRDLLFVSNQETSRQILSNNKALSVDDIVHHLLKNDWKILTGKFPSEDRLKHYYDLCCSSHTEFMTEKQRKNIIIQGLISRMHSQSKKLDQSEEQIACLSDIFLCLDHEEKSAFIITHQLNLDLVHKAIPNIKDIYNPDLVMYAIRSNNMKYAKAIADALSSTANFSIEQRMKCLDLILANKIEEPDSASIVLALINFHEKNQNESNQKNQLILYWVTQNLNKKYQKNPSFLDFLKELLNQDNSWRDLLFVSNQETSRQILSNNKALSVDDIVHHLLKNDWKILTGKFPSDDRLNLYRNSCCASNATLKTKKQRQDIIIASLLDAMTSQPKKQVDPEIQRGYLSDIFLCLDHQEKRTFIIERQLNLELVHVAIPNIRDIYNPDLVMYAIRSNNMKYAKTIADTLSSTANFSIEQRMKCIDLIIARETEEPNLASIVHALINFNEKNPNESNQKNQLILHWIKLNLNNKHKKNSSVLELLNTLLANEENFPNFLHVENSAGSSQISFQNKKLSVDDIEYYLLKKDWKKLTGKFPSDVCLKNYYDLISNCSPNTNLNDENQRKKLVIQTLLDKMYSEKNNQKEKYVRLHQSFFEKRLPIKEPLKETHINAYDVECTNLKLKDEAALHYSYYRGQDMSQKKALFFAQPSITHWFSFNMAQTIFSMITLVGALFIVAYAYNETLNARKQLESLQPKNQLSADTLLIDSLPISSM